MQGCNEGGTIARALNHCGGAERSQQCHEYFLQCNKIAPETAQVRTWGRQTRFSPRARSNLFTPLPWWTSQPETCDMSLLLKQIIASAAYRKNKKCAHFVFRLVTVATHTSLRFEWLTVFLPSDSTSQWYNPFLMRLASHCIKRWLLAPKCKLTCYLAQPLNT